jgi:hypothetical protein
MVQAHHIRSEVNGVDGVKIKRGTESVLPEEVRDLLWKIYDKHDTEHRKKDVIAHQNAEDADFAPDKMEINYRDIVKFHTHAHEKQMDKAMTMAQLLQLTAKGGSRPSSAHKGKRAFLVLDDDKDGDVEQSAPSGFQFSSSKRSRTSDGKSSSSHGLFHFE